LTFRYGAGGGVCGAPAGAAVGPGRPQSGRWHDFATSHAGEPTVSTDPSPARVTAGAETSM
jgi:hypothetical protein